jgi:hypothetical protein
MPYTTSPFAPPPSMVGGPPLEMSQVPHEMSAERSPTAPSSTGAGFRSRSGTVASQPGGRFPVAVGLDGVDEEDEEERRASGLPPNGGNGRF